MLSARTSRAHVAHLVAMESRHVPLIHLLLLWRHGQLVLCVQYPVRTRMPTMMHEWGVIWETPVAAAPMPTCCIPT